MADSVIENMFDLANRYGNYNVNDDPTINYWAEKEKYEAMYEDKSSLSFTDMLSLMVAQFQNQTIDNTADTTDMMNQLVQMSSMQAMTEMTTQLKEVALANVMSYSASLVGQTVTLGIYDSEGKLIEKVGVVEGAGTYDGQQVIFVEGKSYALSSIMAVGKLPPKAETPDEGTEKPGETDTENKDDKVEQTPGTETEDTDDADNSGKVDGADTDNAVG